MRTFAPVSPPKDMDPRVYKVLKRQNDYLQQVGAGLGRVARGKSPDQGETNLITIPPITDHGALDGLTSLTSSGGAVLDYNDDHTQYALLAGRSAGQSLYGSRTTVADGWNPSGAFINGIEPATGATWTTSAGNCISGVPVGYLAIIVVSATIFDAAASYSDGVSTFVSGVTSTPSNTWTKLREFSMTQGGTTSRIVSVWYSYIGTAFVSGTSTILVTFTEANMERKAMQGYQFNIGTGSTIDLISSVDDAQDDVFQPSSMSRSETGETLYIRAITQHASSVNDEDLFIVTGGFTPFLTDQTLSTNAAVDGYVGSRGEFLIGTSGATSQPSIDSGVTNYDFANTFLAIQLTVGTGGLLNLSSLKHSLAANILMSGSTMTANMDFLYFQDAGGSTNLSWIDGTDGSYHIDHVATAPSTGYHIIAAPAANQTHTYAAYTSVQSVVLSGSSLDTSDNTGAFFDLTTNILSGQASLQLRSSTPGDPDLTTFAMLSNSAGVDFLLTEPKPMNFYTDGVVRFTIDELGGNMTMSGTIGINRLTTNQATVDPGITNDDSEEYVVGSRWLNTADRKDFIALDVTTGDADWYEVSGAGSGVTRAYVPAGVTVGVPARNQILVSGQFEVDATGILDIEAGGKLVILQEVA